MTLQTKSPFPGCDPYLQKRWESCHGDMIIAIRDLMRGRLPSGLRPRIESRVFLEETDADGKVQRSNVKPDAFVIEYPTSYPKPSVGSVSTWKDSAMDDDGSTLVAEPFEFTSIPTEIKERYIDIVDVNDGERIITSIELLSPANKQPGQSFERFREKQDMMRAGGVSLVEIDLIRGGNRAISAPTTFKDAGPEILYRIAILRGWERTHGTLYALTLRHQLPTIDLPLRRTDPPLTLNLQAMHDIAYDRGEFAIDLNYQKEAEPPLPAPDAAWSDQMLRAKGLR